MSKTPTVYHRQILNIAVPAIISNVTVPIIGLVDTSITGHLGSAVYLAAIAVGTSIFSSVYWIFNFLRMGTGGLTAQSYGAARFDRCGVLLLRALVLAFLLSFLLILLQVPIAHLMLWAMEGTAAVEALAARYYYILIWGATPTFALFAINGWLIGMQDSRSPMLIALIQNLLNLLLSLFFVKSLGWKLEGVAMGTLLSQWISLFVSLFFVRRAARSNGLVLFSRKLLRELFTNRSEWSRFFSVNRDIFFRTLCLVTVMFSFTRFGTREGESFLSVNALLMQLFMLVSYVLDGFAYAGEALGGKLYGAQNYSQILKLVRLLLLWSLVFAALFSLSYAFGAVPLLSLLTDNTAVQHLAQSYIPYVVVLPLISMSAFVYDGIFIGITATRGMLIGLLWASLGFFSVYYLLHDMLSSHALWVAFLFYLALRGGVQAYLLPQILSKKTAPQVE